MCVINLSQTETIECKFSFLSRTSNLGLFSFPVFPMGHLCQRGLNLKTLISEEALRNFIINELDGDRELFERLYGHFSRHLNEFSSAKFEWATMVALAHKMRSGCHSFGAAQLENKLNEIEETGKANAVTDIANLYEEAKLMADPTLRCIATMANEIFKEIKKSA